MIDPKIRLRVIFNGMKSRCSGKSNPSFKIYGARGISVCDEWSGDFGFDNFYNWAINNGYADNYVIDRIDSSCGYSPRNCQWITKSENSKKGYCESGVYAYCKKYPAMLSKEMFDRTFRNVNKDIINHPNWNLKIITMESALKKIQQK